MRGMHKLRCEVYSDQEMLDVERGLSGLDNMRSTSASAAEHLAQIVSLLQLVSLFHPA